MPDRSNIDKCALLMSNVIHGLLTALWKTLWWILNQLILRADGVRSIVIRTTGSSSRD